MKKSCFCLLALLPLCFVSCFSPSEGVVPGLEVEDPYAARVTFNVTSIEQIPFDGIDTRANLSSLCSRISLVVFDGDTKVKTVNQTKEDAGFGTFNVSLAPGSYQVVVMAHNGNGNCTVSSPDKITFANNKCTDTFYAYQTIEVSGDMNQNVELSRCVAMFRLQTLDAIPAEVAQMQFYYTGGSSTFSAVSGYGCVNSRQTETLNVSASQTGQPGVFEVYTFPHAQTGELKMTVTAFDSMQGTLIEREFSQVPVTINRVTLCTTEFFTGNGSSSTGGLTLGIQNNGEWAGIDEL